MFYRPNKQKKIKLNKIKFRQGIQIIPNVFTLGNAFFGLCSVIFAAQQSWIAASFCVFVGGLMDALDGQIARFVRASSAFGLQLDSLCDAITFCLAPAFLIYIWQLKRLGAIGLIVCGLFWLQVYFALPNLILLTVSNLIILSVFPLLLLHVFWRRLF